MDDKLRVEVSLQNSIRKLFSSFVYNRKNVNRAKDDWKLSKYFFRLLLLLKLKIKMNKNEEHKTDLVSFTEINTGLMFVSAK